jgi:hypothetical protein
LTDPPLLVVGFTVVPIVVELLNVTIPDAAKVVAAVLLPIAPGFKNVLPKTEDAFKFATFVLEETVNGLVPVETVETNVDAVTDTPTCKLFVIPTPPETIKPPVLVELVSVVLLRVTIPLADIVVAAVPDPIAPGFKKVNPFTLEALRLATFVLEETVNGLVPVETVETNVDAVTDTPTCKLFVIPTPPETIKPPVLVELVSVVLLRVTIPLADIVVAAVPDPIAPGFKKVNPFTLEALRLATFVLEEIVNGLVPDAKVLVITPDVEIVVKAPELGVVLPIELGELNVLPFNVEALRLATFVVLDTVKGLVPDAKVLVITPDVEIVVKAPELGVVLPIELGELNVLPFNVEALRLATFVVLDTVKGLVPVETVLDIIPVAEIVVKAPELGVLEPIGPGDVRSGKPESVV